MNKSLEVIQNGYKDCGPSCLLSIIRYYGSDVSHEELSLILKTDNNGTTAYNLINGAKELGFDGYGIKYTYEEIVNSAISFPVIAHVLIDNMYHFIVIYGCHKNKLCIMDPSFGNKKIEHNEFKDIYLGTCIVLYPIKKLSKLNSIKSATKYFIDYIYLERKNFIKFFIISILVVILSIISSYYLQIIIDNIIPNNFYNGLLIISYIFLNILFFKSLLTYFRSRYLINITNNIGIKLNNDTIRHLFNLPYQFFKNKSTGEVLSRVSDIKNLKEIISNIIVNITIDSILIVLSMIVLIIINFKLFLITFIFIIIYYFIVKIYSKIFKKDIESFQIKDASYNKVLTESIEGYETNKNINCINNIVKKIEKSYIVYTKKYMKFENSLINQIYIKDIFMNISYILTTYIGIKYVMTGVLSLGNFIVFNTLLTYFVEPIKDILDLEPNYNYMKNIYNRVNDLLIMRGKTINDVDNMIKGNIEINNLSYSYNNISNTLNNISIKIYYGQKYIICGKSGYGKSTLFKIILKYLNDYKGSIKINNVNLLDIDESIIASSFTYVSQNNYLNNDTLINNIIYDRDISENEYEKIINICHVDKIRDSKVFRNNFVIEDNGFNLSGGERQKIILARALLKKSNFIILDEALSEVGLEEEKEILNKIIDYYKDKTIIYVSHKKEIIDLFENKYYLEKEVTC